ncbi:MAG: ribosomal protein S18-alanine N-acetyltransferase [Clostridia bacterium]|nr:ribosomal protein S18-alanine N-acetyltransferase [Clostridia bacterium]MBQ4131660.1 ribosomal protein S18-alanine N-acetyltransferase [Clostridia bacterium]
MIEKSTNIRKDAQFIAEIERSCFSTPWTVEQIISSEDTTAFFLAKDGEKVIGYGGMYTVLDEGYVTNIGVLPEYRRKGIGSKIVRELINFSIEKSLSFITLEVRVSNVAAIELYKTFEFNEVGRRKNFYRNPTEDAFIMTRYFNYE